MPSLEKIRGVQGLEVFQLKHNSLVAITLSNGNTCLFNPIMNSEEVCSSLKQISHIVSPNHYHNKCLVRFHEKFPKAALCSSTRAKKRLAEITGLKFKMLTSLKRQLPAGMELYEPDGLKTGEVWLRFNFGKSCGWVVGDAFCGDKGAVKETKTPKMLGTFPSYGVADKEKYVEWVLNRLDSDKPTLIIPCHGNMIRAASLPKALKALLQTL